MYLSVMTVWLPGRHRPERWPRTPTYPGGRPGAVIQRKLPPCWLNLQQSRCCAGCASNRGGAADLLTLSTATELAHWVSGQAGDKLRARIAAAAALRAPRRHSSDARGWLNRSMDKGFDRVAVVLDYIEAAQRARTSQSTEDLQAVERFLAPDLTIMMSSP